MDQEQSRQQGARGPGAGVLGVEPRFTFSTVFFFTMLAKITCKVRCTF